MDYISNFLELHIYWAYLILFVLMFIEGEGALLLFGFLSRLGHFSFPVLLLSAIFFIMVGDAIWYWLGLKFWQKIKERFEDRLILYKPYNFIKSSLQNHAGKAIFISKFIYGFNHAVIFAAGAAKINFRKFLQINLGAATVFASIFLILGFVLGEGYRAVGESFRHFSLIAGGTLLLLFVLSRFLKKTLKR